MPSALTPGEPSQRALLRERSRWAGMAAVLDAMPVGACALLPAGAPLPNGQQTGAGGPQVALGNAALERLLNYAAGDLAGCPLSQLWAGPPPMDLCAEALEGHARRSDGALVPARLTARSLSEGDEGPRTPLLVATIEDLRPLRELQGRLLGAERLMAQGALVAGVAHEVNNPAHLLLANVHDLELVLGELLPPSGPEPAGARRERLLREVRGMLADAHEATRRIIDVVRDLVQLSHPEAVPAEPVDLAQLALAVLRLCRPVLRGVRVYQELEAAQPVRAQRPRLFQVLLNLLINAAHAVEEVAETRRAIWLRLQPEESFGQAGVHLEVEDTGCGIPVAMQARLCEPFFTTKGAGRGTGLGLALSRAIVEQHGGTLSIHSRPGQGTRVGVWLPLSPPREPGGSPAAALLRGGAR